MTLNDLPIYSIDHNYVIKLHRDSRPGEGVLAGRIEHLPTGYRAFFKSAGELSAAITRLALAVEFFPDTDPETRP